VVPSPVPGRAEADGDHPVGVDGGQQLDQVRQQVDRDAGRHVVLDGGRDVGEATQDRADIRRPAHAGDEAALPSHPIGVATLPLPDAHEGERLLPGQLLPPFREIDRVPLPARLRWRHPHVERRGQIDLDTPEGIDHRDEPAHVDHGVVGHTDAEQFAEHVRDRRRGRIVGAWVQRSELLGHSLVAAAVERQEVLPPLTGGAMLRVHLLEPLRQGEVGEVAIHGEQRRIAGLRIDGRDEQAVDAVPGPSLPGIAAEQRDGHPAGLAPGVGRRRGGLLGGRRRPLGGRRRPLAEVGLLAWRLETTVLGRRSGGWLVGLLLPLVGGHGDRWLATLIGDEHRADDPVRRRRVVADRRVRDDHDSGEHHEAGANGGSGPTAARQYGVRRRPDALRVGVEGGVEPEDQDDEVDPQQPQQGGRPQHPAGQLRGRAGRQPGGSPDQRQGDDEQQRALHPPTHHQLPGPRQHQGGQRGPEPASGPATTVHRTQRPHVRLPTPGVKRARYGRRGRPPTTRTPGGASALAGLQFLDQLGHDVVEVADDAEVRDLEDRRLGVLVDGDDVLRRLHPCPVLDRTRDTRPEVQRR